MKRKIYIIESGFQVRLITQIMGLVLFSTIITGLFSFGFSKWQDQRTQSNYEAGNTADLGVFAGSSRADFILPSLIFAGVVNIISAGIFGVLISHRLAGPIYRLKSELQTVMAGKDLRHTFKLRDGDEFDGLAGSLNDFVRGLRDKLDNERRERFVNLGVVKRILKALIGSGRMPPEEARLYSFLEDLLERMVK